MRNKALSYVHLLAKQDPRVVFIGSDLAAGTLDEMNKTFPDRFFMEGVSEQHIIGMAAGMAMEGFIPYVNTIATFLTRRCFEQICLDLCLHDLPVRLIGNGGGYVYAPLGPTHLATEDIAIMRTLPKMTIVAPCDSEEMARLMQFTLDWPHPIYIRLAKGGDEIVSRQNLGFKIGKGILMESGDDLLLISTGIMTQRALKVRDNLLSHGISSSILHLHTLKPLDKLKLIKNSINKKLIVTLEEHSCIGGLGSAVLEQLAENDINPFPHILRFALPDQFSQNYGTQDELLEHHGLGVETITKSIRKFLINL